MKTMADLIERNEAYYPHAEAFTLDERSLTYQAYAQRSRRLASALYGLGMRRQDRVGILSTNNLEYLEAYGACEWAGYILALYNFRLAQPEVAWLLQDTAPKVVLFEASHSELLDGLRAQYPVVETWVCIGDNCPPWALAYDSLLARGTVGGPPIRARVDDYVYLYYTSGTTGRPKGVPQRQSAALATARMQGRQLGQDLRVLQITPFFHIGGKGFPLASMWMAGTTVVQRSFDPLKFLEAVQRHRITFAFMVAPMIQAVLDHPRFHEFDTRSLRSVMSASAAIPVPLLKRAIETFGPVFFISYGSTEAGGICTLERHELKPDGTPEEIKRLGSVGHFNQETEAAILDEDGVPCGVNEVGEVCVKNPTFDCYWNNTVATIEATRSGYLHTGDLGYLDEEGYVYLVDRKKDMIISGGENIYSREVEDALYRHAAVLDAAVIGVADAKWGESVKAIVVLRPGANADGVELIAHCQTQIARYKCPRTVELVSDLPRLGTGKIDKVALRRRYASQE